MSSYSARDRMGAVKQFVRWCYERDIIDKLPRILRMRTQSMAIEVQDRPIEVLTPGEIKTLVASASQRTKLYILLMLNCGMTQKDVSDLQQDEVDWTRGYITRIRSKSRRQKSTPRVSYKLWPTTFRLLKSNRSHDASLALTNENGSPLRVEEITSGRVRKVDNIKSAWNRLRKKTGIKKPLKLLRKTASTRLGSHTEFGRFAQHFLGHAPTTVAVKWTPFIGPRASDS